MGPRVQEKNIVVFLIIVPSDVEIGTADE